MRQLLDDIQSGAYAKGWMEEHAKGRPWFNATRKAEQDHVIEQVGARLRALMPFLNPVTIEEAGAGASPARA
jgi:ketol-acid reductoisomerase